jgi:peptide/nickel transport system substrate-binding protein
MQSMDWQTLVGRRTKKDVPSAGGWHAFLTSWGSVDVLNPVSTGFLNASCEKAMFGWPCDPKMEELRDAFARETDPAKQKAIAETVQLRQAEAPTHIHLGQYTQPTAYRKTVSGVLTAASGVMWNIEKK